MRFLHLLALASTAVVVVRAQGCPDYSDYSEEYHAPFSTGRYNLSYQRPSVDCRTFISPVVENTIASLNSTITDPDLYRLFLNSYPNTLDTAIKWKGYANGTDEELTFVITGDMCAFLTSVYAQTLTDVPVMPCGSEILQIRCSHICHCSMPQRLTTPLPRFTVESLICSHDFC